MIDIHDMNHWLATRWYGNPVRSWLIALGVLAAVFAALVAARVLGVRRLAALVRRTRTDLDDLVVDLLARTRYFFLLTIAVVIAAQAVDLSARVTRDLRTLVVLAVLLQVGLWANGVITFWVRRFLARRGPDEAASVTTVWALSVLARVGLWSIVLLLTLDNLGVNVTALITGLGITGVAVALAVQNVLGDLFGALSIVLDKPFVVGDFIDVDQYSGTVEYVGLRTTRLRSLSGEQIVISNTELLKSRIRNYQRLRERRVAFATEVVYQTRPEQVERIPRLMREIVEAQPAVRFDRSHFSRYTDNGLAFETVYFVTNPDYNLYMDIQQAINLALLRRFGDEGIEFASPTRLVVVRGLGEALGRGDGARDGAGGDARGAARDSARADAPADVRAETMRADAARADAPRGEARSDA